MNLVHSIADADSHHSLFGFFVSGLLKAKIYNTAARALGFGGQKLKARPAHYVWVI